jgi:hypothetical protein
MRNAAREVMGLTQYKAGKLDDAMKSFEAILEDPQATRDTQSRVQIYMLQLQAEGAKPIAPPADATTSSAPPAEASSAAPPVTSSEAPATTSSEASAAVDASTELDVTPPPVVDTSVLSMAAPNTSSEAVASSAALSSDAVSSSEALSSEPANSSSAPATSSEPVASSAPVSSSAP